MVLRTGEGKGPSFPRTQFFSESISLTLYMVDGFTCGFKFLF